MTGVVSAVLVPHSEEAFEAARIGSRERFARSEVDPRFTLAERREKLGAQFERCFDHVLRELGNFGCVSRKGWVQLLEVVKDPDFDWRMRLPRFLAAPLALAIQLGDMQQLEGGESFLPMVLSLPERAALSASANAALGDLLSSLPRSLSAGSGTCSQVAEALEDLSSSRRQPDSLSFLVDYYHELSLPKSSARIRMEQSDVLAVELLTLARARGVDLCQAVFAGMGQLDPTSVPVPAFIPPLDLTLRTRVADLLIDAGARYQGVEGPALLSKLFARVRAGLRSCDEDDEMSELSAVASKLELAQLTAEFRDLLLYARRLDLDFQSATNGVPFLAVLRTLPYMLGVELVEKARELRVDVAGMCDPLLGNALVAVVRAYPYLEPSDGAIVELVRRLTAIGVDPRLPCGHDNESAITIVQKGLLELQTGYRHDQKNLTADDREVYRALRAIGKNLLGAMLP